MRGLLSAFWFYGNSDSIKIKQHFIYGAHISNIDTEGIGKIKTA